MSFLRIASRACLLSACLGAGGRGALFAQPAPAVTGRPNVLFIAVDDMRDWVGYMGGYRGMVHTPNIDQLAAQGVAFTNAHCPSPLCNPSRAAVMTGRMPSQTGVYDNSQWLAPNRPDMPTLPTHFRAHGYTTVGAGKIFHHTAGSNPPVQWDAYHHLYFLESPWFRSSKLNYPWSRIEKPPAEFPFSRVAGLGGEFDWGSLPIASERYDDALTVDYAIDFLARPQSKPFFLACGIFRPHLPWYAPKHCFDLYPLETIKLPPVKDDDLEDIPPTGRKWANNRNDEGAKIKQADAWKRAIQAYLASISYADEQVGRLLRKLAHSSFAENTIVVLWSDHGWHLGEKGHWHKTTLWENATRVPLVVKAPGVTRDGHTCSRPVNLIDLFPTLSRLCGLSDVPGLSGVDLSPLLRNPGLAWERPSVIEYLDGNAAVRSERFRYIRYKDGTEELYDHLDDPHEWHNLAADVNQAATKESLRRWLPARWAVPLPAKGAFEFDPDEYSWRAKATGIVVSAKGPPAAMPVRQAKGEKALTR